MGAKSPHSCLSLYDPMDCSPPGSSVQGILQARYRNGLPLPPPGDLLTQGSNLHLLRLLHWQVGSLLLAPLGKPVRCTKGGENFSVLMEACVPCWSRTRWHDLRVAACAPVISPRLVYEVPRFPRCCALHVCVWRHRVKWPPSPVLKCCLVLYGESTFVRQSSFRPE